jgi:hypothetical protein
MATPWRNLQKEVYSRLTTNVPFMASVTGVFDFVPDNQAYPYVTIGDTEFQDRGTKTFEIFDGQLTIHVWARPGSRGRAPVMDIMTAIYDLLQEHTFTGITGFNTINLRYEFSTVLVEPDRVTYHGVIRFSILLGGT